MLTQTLEGDWSDHMQNHQADSPLYVWPDVWSADLHLFIKNMVIHDTKCPYWDQVSLNNTKQSKTVTKDVFSYKSCIKESVLKCPTHVTWVVKQWWCRGGTVFSLQSSLRITISIVIFTLWTLNDLQSPVNGHGNKCYIPLLQKMKNN